jgi:hypothetical protein
LWDSKNSLNSGHSQHIRLLRVPKQENAGIRYDHLAIQKGVEYAGSVWLRGTIRGKVAILLTAFEKGKGPVTWDDAEIGPVNNSWREYPFRLRSSATTNANLDIVAFSPGDLWIDQVCNAPQQLTHLAAYGFIEDFSPDGQFIVFSCSSGVFLMRSDGSEQTKIISEPVRGNLQWSP